MESFIARRRGVLVAAWMLAILTAPVALAAASAESAPAEPGTLEPLLELAITGPQKAAVGSEVTFDLVVANAGKGPASGLMLVDHFEPGLEHAAAPSPIEHDLQDLRPGQSQRLGLTFSVTAPGKLSHRVEVTRKGKVIAAAQSTVTATGSKQAGTAQEPAAPPKPPKVEHEKPVQPKPARLAKPKEPEFEFPEVMPREEPPTPAEPKPPDLGPPLVEDAADLKRLDKKHSVWIDRKQNRVVLVGVVCAREVTLELFACLMHSKEHESVVAVPTKATFVHAALLAVGAKAGSPAQFRPKYVPASGTEIEITCVWKDESGKRRTARAQDWVRNAKTRKALEYPWVFAGSRFRKDPDTGETFYQADSDGDLICVSNFPGATLDLPIQSTSADTELLFEAFTENIPPRSTPVTLILTPKLKKSGPGEAPGEAQPKSAAPSGEKSVEKHGEKAAPQPRPKQPAGTTPEKPKPVD